MTAGLLRLGHNAFNSSPCDQVQVVEASTPRIVTQQACLRNESGDTLKHDALETDTSKELALIAGRVGFDTGLTR